MRTSSRECVTNTERFPTTFMASIGSYFTKLSPEETLPAKRAASLRNTGKPANTNSSSMTLPIEEYGDSKNTDWSAGSCSKAMVTAPAPIEMPTAPICSGSAPLVSCNHCQTANTSRCSRCPADTRPSSTVLFPWSRMSNKMTLNPAW